MNSILLDNASKAEPNIGILVNMVRQRVRQLVGGARPLIVVPPGLSVSDIALTEIAAKKLTSERVLAAVAELASAPIINFPNVKPAGKAA
jgi:DNA-directed RNA polymerase subunit K/omega